MQDLLKPHHHDDEQFGDITILSLDHPGAQDPLYRARRDQIANVARTYACDPSITPIIEYTPEEHGVWNTVTKKLKPLHEKYISNLHLRSQKELNISTESIPQLHILSEAIERKNGFRLAPTVGLIHPRDFLSALGERTMLCTQYIRHASKPEYTPEPDVIHEVIGHAPAFMDRDMVDFSVTLGSMAKRANAQELVELERLYWYTIEFGLIQEKGNVKAFGAGLLSSFGELEHAMNTPEIHRPFRLDEVINTPYDFSAMQTVLFVMPSFTEIQKQVTKHFQHIN